MIFLTIGTQFPFDRLVRAIDDIITKGLIGEEVFGQVGENSYKPLNFESVVSLEKQMFDRKFKEASAIIGHAGMGTIAMALDNHKPLLVMPRSKKYGEVVNNHQVAIARRFSELGHILTVYDVKDLPDGIHKLENFTPGKRKASPELIGDRIHCFLSSLQA